MYQEFFGFSDRPFKAAPATKHYVPCHAIDHARQTILRGIDRGDGPAIVVGPAGSGKSLLAQLLSEQLATKFHVALLSSARLDSCRTLLQSILFELQLPYRELEEGEMRLELIDFLRHTKQNNGLLLLVDEAHTLPLRLLEEIRLITNIVDHGSPRVRLVLFGGAQLEERFASPKLDSFNQRIASRSYLQSLNFDETVMYVREQVRKVGGQGGKVFGDEAAKSVYRATDGIPRLINQICDHALMLAFLAGKTSVSPEFIEEAWADLQQLPTPWETPRGGGAEPAHAPASKAEVEGVLEFGTLDDEFPAWPVAPSSLDERVEKQLTFLANSLHNYDQGAYAENLDLEEPIGPAIELNFPGAGHIAGGPNEVTIECASPAELFGSFEDEEPIVDRYAKLDAAKEAKPVKKAKVIPPVKVQQPAAKTVNGPPKPVPLPKPEPVVQAEVDLSLDSFSITPVAPLYEDAAPGIVTSSWQDVASADLPVQRFVAMIDAIDLTLELDKFEPVAEPVAAPVKPEVKPAPLKVVPKATVVQKPTGRDFDPADDPVTPEVITLDRPVAEVHDDRDLLVIEGQESNRSAPPKRGRYRQLFSTMRRREGTGS